MRNKHWLRLLVTFALLGLAIAAGNAQAADGPAKGELGYCSEAPRPAAGPALSGRLSDGELCSAPQAMLGPTAGGWSVAGPANGGGTLSLVVFVGQAVTWRDAGAARPSAATGSAADGWMAAIANRERLTANPAIFAAAPFTWGDAGAGRS